MIPNLAIEQTERPGTSDLTILSFCFLTGKMEIIITSLAVLIENVCKTQGTE